jgi:exonuclease VII small subunit
LKTKEQLLVELSKLNNKITELEKSETEKKQAEEKLKRHREHLEELVGERTKELEEKNAELDRAMKMFVGRELTIKNLQKRISSLEKNDK